MATRWMPRLLLVLVVCSGICVSTPMAADEVALLAIKAAAVPGGYGNTNALASWNSSSTAGTFCGWEGVMCGGRHQRVVALSLPSRGLSGVLSPAIGNLSFLRTLDLSSNGLSGGNPASIGNLCRLQTLNLSDNALSGELPANLSSCTGLTVLAIRLNRLHGHMPSELGDKLASLRTLDLRNNNLTGTIPVSIANLSSLSYLSLAFNQLQGNIPDLDGILGLERLDFAYNSLSGELPSSIYNLSKLQIFQIQGNMFHGGIPADIGSRFPSMRILGFSRNQFTGPIPASLSNLTNLQFILLSSNGLTGHVPPTLGRLQALQGLYLYNNKLQADDRAEWEFITSLSNCSQLQQLTIDGNPGLTGQVPSQIGNLSTTLQVLLLDDTGISGRIPSAIGNLAGLQVHNLANTSITGVIPESIGKLGNLGVLHLYNTGLSGSIPSSIGNLSNLFQLSAYNSSLEGAIPPSLGKLTNLQSLDLSMNRLNGSIPIEIFRLPIISKYLNLSHNLLSGFLPSEVGKLSNLNILDLSENKLSGGIPDSIGECIVLQGLWLDNNSFEGSIPQSLNNIKGLTTLNLSMNKLSGTIPGAIGSIRNLQQLYLARNNLTGPIPTILQNLTSLSQLDLSFNNLQGEVPKEGIFRNLSSLSITGNNGLCGGMPQLNLDPCHTSSLKKNTKGWLKSLTIALATIGAFMFLAFMIALIQLKGNKLRRRKKSPFLPPITDEQYERVSYHALANGTNGFAEANLLGKGSFGAVYKCTFQDEGTVVAVKVFNLEQVGSTRSFVAECEALRRVHHRCLMKIITSCSSINHQGQEFKALVFEYMPNGSLDGWLHPKSETPTQTDTLSLEQRLHIAVDIMDAMDYLHNHCHPPVLHCDLKPSNILLAEDMSARIGDFGISRILPECASKTLQNSNRTIGTRGSIGYVAPEYGEGSSASTLGDVYSIGILLLEMFTGRRLTDDIFRGSLDLRKFSEDALPEKIWEITDTTMWLHTYASDSTTRSKVENCLVSVIALGISCSSKQPRERKPIKDAAIEMHAIRDTYLKFSTPSCCGTRSNKRSAVISTKQR